MRGGANAHAQSRSHLACRFWVVGLTHNHYSLPFCPPGFVLATGPYLLGGEGSTHCSFVKASATSTHQLTLPKGYPEQPGWKFLQSETLYCLLVVVQPQLEKPKSHQTPRIERVSFAVAMSPVFCIVICIIWFCRSIICFKCSRVAVVVTILMELMSNCAVLRIWEAKKPSGAPLWLNWCQNQISCCKSFLGAMNGCFPTVGDVRKRNLNLLV